MKLMKNTFLHDLEVIYDAGSRIAHSLSLMNKPDASEELRREISAHAQLTKAHLKKVRRTLDSLQNDFHPADDSLSSSDAWIEALIREENLPVSTASWTKECGTAANLLEIIVREDDFQYQLCERAS